MSWFTDKYFKIFYLCTMYIMYNIKLKICYNKSDDEKKILLVAFFFVIQKVKTNR